MSITRYTVANGQILAEGRDGGARRYAADPLGSTVALVNPTGTITDTFTYWPYGEERTRTGTTPTPFRFGGTLGYYRDDAGRTYVRARALAPRSGRWLTPDPVTGLPDLGPLTARTLRTDPDSLGREDRATAGREIYGYAASNPTSWQDVDGRAPAKPGPSKSANQCRKACEDAEKNARQKAKAEDHVCRRSSPAAVCDAALCLAESGAAFAKMGCLLNCAKKFLPPRKSKGGLKA